MNNYTYHGTRDLIALPGRSVQTYPSGLVRVERSFMCRKSDVARYRNILRVNEPMPFDDGAPAIDGLFIFPEPQEQVRDDGFVEFRVTAYGRTSATGIIEKSFKKGVFNCFVNDTREGEAFFSFSVLIPAIMPTYVQKIVLQDSQVFDFSFQINVEVLPTSVGMTTFSASESGNIEFSQQFVPYEVWENFAMTGPSPAGLLFNGIRLTTFGPTSDTPFSGKQKTSYTLSREVTSVNFGAFSEYTITYEPYFQVELVKT